MFSPYGERDSKEKEICAFRVICVKLITISLHTNNGFSTHQQWFPYTKTSFSLHENIVFSMRKFCFPYEKTKPIMKSKSSYVKKGCNIAAVSWKFCIFAAYSELKIII